MVAETSWNEAGVKLGPRGPLAGIPESGARFERAVRLEGNEGNGYVIAKCADECTIMSLGGADRAGIARAIPGQQQRKSN
jgi:hypothetical protein